MQVRATQCLHSNWARDLYQHVFFGSIGHNADEIGEKTLEIVYVCVF